MRSVAWAGHLTEALLVTEHILCETINNLSKRADRIRSHRIMELVDDSNYTVIHATPELFAAGLKLHRARPDKDWSLTDCISFHIMSERGIARALAYDIHFEQTGFEALLRRDPTESDAHT